MNYVFLFLSLISLFFQSCATSYKPVFLKQSVQERKILEAVSENWMVSTQGRAASAAVETVFNSGGNIVDAAVAASFAISVERPQSTGLGGGGFMLYREAVSGKIWVLDFRERAPAKSSKNMYLDSSGNVIKNKSTVGKHAVGIPGLVRGLAEVHKKFGKIKFDQLIEPAIQIAENGLVVNPKLEMALKEMGPTLSQFKNSKKIFLKSDGKNYVVGEKIFQKDLANSLRRIAKSYGEDFYTGQIAKKIVQSTGGQITLTDLKNYKVKWREPLRQSFKEYEIVSMPPPSSGGTHVIQILNLLENENLNNLGLHSEASIIKTAKAMQFAFMDRARYMADPEFVKIPLKTLISKNYAASIKATELWRHNPKMDVNEMNANWQVLPESSETTHFSIMDKQGNVVVSTQTINGWFGSGMVAENTGIILNNEMDDFSAKPGDLNLFGALGSSVNSVAPGKTPLSSMSPTIVLKNNEPILALGAPGGTRIISCVANTILNYLEYKMPIYDSVTALRIHQQWKPDELHIENGFDSGLIKDLEEKGWKIKSSGSGCAIMAVAREGNKLIGVSEPRDFGQALGR
jgi:gamma-glutamyltranspeptidase/glutathione hydrolase